MDDGSFVEKEITEDEYTNLGSPSILGGTWIHSYSDHKYDTLSGRLEDGYYAEEGGGKLVKLAGCCQTKVDSSLISPDNTVDSSKETSIINLSKII